ncbi:TerB family tellurite resistance protein [Candidatus Colwellia aromaticivorans]|uniref:TerB family tellurite resistance protein n=1 Tax=Candidatus Colwellia aromaticivorans TaxID=2267621 RepID=UPI000DF4BC82|nr:TerB family tellurite resistance protein [Candidatus Colwellia aromaticivorans]
MFESLKHWLENLDEESQLFEHADSEVIHIALASLLYHIIRSDSVENDNEKQEFKLIMANEFQLSDQQIMVLYSYVKTLKSDLKSDLLTVNDYLKDNPNLRMMLMKKLLQLIAVNGVNNEELNIFYEAMAVIFPDIAKKLTDS